MLDPRDDPAFAAPGAGGVGKFAEQALFLPRRLKVPGRPVQPRLRQIVQTGILGDADDIVHIMPVAPVQHAVAAEAGIPAQDDPHLRPGLAQAPHQQGQDRPGVFGAVDVRGPQVADRKLIATEHIKRQETVVVVIALKETALLVAVNRIVGGVEVEDQLVGRVFARGDEGLHQNLVRGPSHLAVGRVLEPAQRRRTGWRLIPIGRRLQCLVVAQGVVVVQILVTQGQAVDPLPQHISQTVLNLARLPVVGQPPGKRCRQSQQVIRPAQQQNAAVARHMTSIEAGGYPAFTTGWKFQMIGGTICHR